MNKKGLFGFGKKKWKEGNAIGEGEQARLEAAYTHHNKRKFVNKVKVMKETFAGRLSSLSVNEENLHDSINFKPVSKFVQEIVLAEGKKALSWVVLG